MSKVNQDLKKFFDKLTKQTKDAQSRPVYKQLAEELIKIIVKRTRLGYGVDRSLGERSKLKALSPRYIKARKDYLDIDSSTRPSKSNLTLTGQMLRSIDIIKQDARSVTIGPTGRRDDGYTNQEIAEFNRKTGRIFNNVSVNEFNQIRRIYRKTFGDLLKKNRLLK